ncbi:MAG: hypothetical protein LBP85_10065 [Prevotellaceae bacterium]|nr:hypothetical protein [Prevotellaceae bacterium]
MVGIIIKIILGLFVLLAIPPMLLSKRKFKKYKRFISVVCTMLSILILVFTGIDLVKTLLNIK